MVRYLISHVRAYYESQNGYPANAYPFLAISHFAALTLVIRFVGWQHALRRSWAEFGLPIIGLFGAGIAMLEWGAPKITIMPGLLLALVLPLLWAPLRLASTGLSISLMAVGRGSFASRFETFQITTSLLRMVLASLAEKRCQVEDSLNKSGRRIAFPAASDASRWRRYIARRCLWCLLIVVSQIICLPVTAASPARILIINAWDDTMPAAGRATTAIRNRLSESPLKNAEIYYDNLDLSRFPENDHQEHMARWLSEKYAEKSPDIIIALGRVALEYLLKHRHTFAPDVPIIVCYWAGATPATIATLKNVTGVFSEFNWSKTFALAARLQPKAREVAIVLGTSVPFWEEQVYGQLAAQLGPYKVRYLAGLPYDTLLDKVARLPRDTIVLISPMFKDGDGVSRIPARVAADVARASSAPTYAPISTFVGTGIVGGYMDTFEASGSAAAELAIEVLERRGKNSLPPPVTTQHNFVVDLRQLQRWNLSQGKLPSGTTLMFKEPTLWEQYRSLVLITVGVFTLLVSGVVALSYQILKRRRAEATLEANDERMRFAASSTDTGLWQYDVLSRHLWATEHCRSMFGLDADSKLRPESFLRVVHSDDRATAIAAMQAAPHPKDPVRGREFRTAGPDGQIRWYFSTTSTEFDKNGEPLRVSGIFSDITSRKKAEQEAAQLKNALQTTTKELARVSRETAMGAMAASIAHEINQPLSALVTNGGIGLRLLANPGASRDEVREILECIIDDGHRAGHIIAGIRAMFRRDPRERSTVNITDLVSEVLALLQAELDSNRISFQVESHQGLPSVLADRVQLQQVLLNLILNAVEAMSSAHNLERRLLVKSERFESSDVLITVEDSGPGIGPKNVDRIFDAFFTTKSNGTGLGLFICQSIVEAHRGRLWASARLPHGAIFYVRLPGTVLDIE